MTKRISSPSVKATPKTADEPDTNGTPPIEEHSETTSEIRLIEETGWTLQFSNGAVHHIRVKGGRGRISFSSGGRGGNGEVRIYRNESTKVFDAVFTGVTQVISDRVEAIPVSDGDALDRSTPNFRPKRTAKKKTAVASNTGGVYISTTSGGGISGWSPLGEVEEDDPNNPPNF